MANFYSDQLTNLEQTTPPVMSKPHELAGRVRIARFSYTTPSASAPGVGDIVAFTKLPIGAVVVDGALVWEALSSAGGTAGADWSLANDKLGTGIGTDFFTALN